MKYMGSKNRIAKYIIPIILKDRKEEQYFVDVFAGGMNIIDKIDGNKIANDNNAYLIAMWKDFISGRILPEDITKDLYSDVRNCFNTQSDKYDTAFVGWIGFIGSANGRFFEGGYSGKSNTKAGTVRDYIAESIRNINKQKEHLKDVCFISGDYKVLEIPSNSILYCDIPYCGVKKYSTSKNFNYDEFWQWCRNKTKEGHTIYISEYSAPKDFKCIWEMEIKSSLSANGKAGGNKSSIEKLYQYGC